MEHASQLKVNIAFVDTSFRLELLSAEFRVDPIEPEQSQRSIA